MVSRIGIVGAGTMGQGIAQLAAQNGIEVTIRDIDQDIVDNALESIQQNLRDAEEAGFIEDGTKSFEHVTGTTELTPVTENVQMVIEAINEDIDLKRSIFSELDEHCDPDVTLGSNTSSISITEVANVTDHPERVIGVHFFNPPVKMKLIEIITGYYTSDEVVQEVENFANEVGSESVLVEDYPGFTTSRLGVVLGMEAARMVQEGVATVEDIDTAMEMGYNLPVGPLKLGDHNGWDVRVEVGEYLAEEFGRDVYRPPQNVKQMVRAGNYGVKTGQGFYSWGQED